MNNKEFKHILYLPAWYPHPKDSMFGLFIKNHALAVSKFINVSILYVVFFDDLAENFKVEIKTDTNFTELIIMVKKTSKRWWLIGKIIQLIRFLSAYRAGYKIINDSVGKPDLTHVHILTRVGVIALWYKMRYGIPYLISEHWSRYLPEHKSFNGFIRRWIAQKVVAKSELVITVSKYLQDAMKSNNLHSKRWELIPNTVDVKRFRSDTSESGKSVCRMFHISCFEDKSKNISGILKSIAKLAEKRDDFEMVMIGDGIDMSIMKKLTKDLRIEKFVNYVGVLEGDELVSTINSCDFLVLYSNYETFGTVVLESFACGKPALVSDGGALPEIADQRFAKIVQSKNIDVLADGMDYMIDNYKEYPTDEMIEYVTENFSVESVGFLLNKIYQSILGK